MRNIKPVHDSKQVIAILNHYLAPGGPDTYAKNELRKRLTPIAERDDIGMLYTILAAHGYVEALEAVVDLCGKVPVEYEQQPSTDPRFPEPSNTLNGLSFYLNTRNTSLLTAIKTPSELNRLLELIPQIGLGFLTGIDSPHSILLDKLPDILKTTDLLKPGYEGNLPVLDVDHKRVEQPELLLALEARAKHSSYPEAFKHLLCWVPNHAVKANPDTWRTYQSQQDLSVTINKSSGAWVDEHIDMRTVDADELNRIFNTTACLYRGFRLKTARDADTVLPMDDCLLQALGSAEINHGFGFKKGYALCRVHMDEINGFKASAPESDAMQKATAFAADYEPIGVIAAHYGTQLEPGISKAMAPIGIEGDISRHHSVSNAVNKMLGHIGAHDSVGKALLYDFSPVILKKLITQSPPNIALKTDPLLDLEGIIVAVTQLDLATHLLNGYIPVDEVDRFLASDVRISDKTLVIIPSLLVKKGKWSSTRELLINISSQIDPTSLTHIFDKGARFINGHDLTDVRKSMSKLGNPKLNNADMSLHIARIRSEGLEYCVKVARSEMQWTSMEIAFGKDAVRPFLGKAPKQHKAKILSDDLGL